MSFRTRFAPSPTGPLHLGHAYSAITAHDMARAEGGEFLLRIEDIDQSRARPEWEEMIYDDLTWLGLCWEEPVMRQSERMDAYRNAIVDLDAEHQLIFPCECNRKDILAATTAPNEGDPMIGPDGLIYPGTCRGKKWDHRLQKESALRFDMAKVVASDTLPYITDASGKSGSKQGSFFESGSGPNGENGRIVFTAEELIKTVGDIVIARRDMGTSYHLSVVVDDAAQEITHVVRGEDLFDATKIHVVLQRLLDLPTPTYHHHRLIRDDAGKRLAKRDDARAIHKYREDGASPEDIRRMVGL